MKRYRVFAVVLAFIFLISPIAGLTSAFGETRTNPVTNNGKKWRFAYYEGGPYVDYQTILGALFLSFAELGWIESIELPVIDDPKDTKQLWMWAAKNIKSQYLEFVEDAYYCSDWKPEEREVNKRKAIERLKSGGLDYMLAFGTWAGQDLANNEHSTPVEVLSSSDPLKSGIIKSLNDSGYDHVHAKCEPTRYQRQIELFHDIVGFKKLGVAYEDTVDGRSYAAIDSIEKVAKDRGFEIVRCDAQFSGIDKKKAIANIKECFAALAPKIDALYITTHRGVNIRTLPRVLPPIFEYNIPTFSQSGSDEVKHGVLMSIAQAQYTFGAKFHADTIAKVLNGAKPRSIPMIFESPLKIAINLAVAQKIGFDPPVDVLGAADEIYQEIEVAAEE